MKKADVKIRKTVTAPIENQPARTYEYCGQCGNRIDSGECACSEPVILTAREKEA